MNRRARAILWLDGGAACAAGLFVLGLRELLTALYALPAALLAGIGTTNLAYASYACSLAILPSMGRIPSRRAVDLLILLNLTWTAICLGMLLASAREASRFGIAHLALEGLFVGALAVAERRLVRPFAR